MNLSLDKNTINSKNYVDYGNFWVMEVIKISSNLLVTMRSFIVSFFKENLLVMKTWVFFFSNLCDLKKLTIVFQK
jgi:hypothetical protein